MKESQTLTFSEVLRDLFEEEPDLHEAYLGHRALALLPEILGAGHRYVSGAEIRDGVLLLRVRSSSARQHFLQEGARILRRVNDAVGAELLRELRLY